MKYIFKARKSSLLACLLVGLLGLAMVGQPYAAETKLPPEYLAGFAFFKYAKGEPDFEVWVKNSPAYKKASPAQRVNMVRLEVPMLQGKFDGHVVSEHPIIIKPRVTFMVPTVALAKRMIEEQGIITIPMKLVDQQEDIFPIQLADMWIAMIPRNFERVMTLKLTEQQLINFKKQAKSSSVTGRAEALLHLTLLPTGADTVAPLQLNSYDLWMLSVDIIGAEIWDIHEKKMAWYIEVPGHEKSRRNTEIFNLFEN